MNIFILNLAVDELMRCGPLALANMRESLIFIKLELID